MHTFSNYNCSYCQRKTGGLVVWRSGSIIILYRGTNYKYPYFHYGDETKTNVDGVSPESSMEDGALDKQGVNSMPARIVNSSAGSVASAARSSLVVGIGSPNKVRLQQPGEAQLEEETDRLLDGLGPRFADWWGYDPLPVDADLLPAIVPGFRKPFRLLPFGIKPKLTDREMTTLRRLSRHLPCHFALGEIQVPLFFGYSLYALLAFFMLCLHICDLQGEMGTIKVWLFP